MDHQHDWYKSFFQGMALDMWSQALPQAFTDSEIKFIEAHLPVSPGAALLDVPCGYGRHALALAKKGCAVMAIDIAEDYIQQLRASAGESLPNIHAVHADILEYPLQGEFDGAICMGNSFGYFPYGDMLRFCNNVAHALPRGKKFVINTGLLAESILPDLRTGNKWMEINDMLYLREHMYLPEESILKSTMKFVRGGKTETGVAYYYVHTLAEVKRMLATAGFETVEAFGNVEGTPFKLGDPQAYLVATKG
jgi:SAM-dependent methyltransferase